MSKMEYERYYFRTPDGSIFSAPAANKREALNVAIQEFPEYDRIDFKETDKNARPRSSETDTEQV